MTEADNELIQMTIDVVTAYVSQNNLRPEDVPSLISSVHKSIVELQSRAGAPADVAGTLAEQMSAEHVPAVTVRKSLASPDHIISMIDGKPYKLLKRHLSLHGLTPAEYRARYGLKADYPMVAPTYAAQRKELAVRIGLGAKVKRAKPAPAAPQKITAKRGPKPKAAATPASE